MLANKIVAVDSLVFLQVSLTIQTNSIMHKFSEIELALCYIEQGTCLCISSMLLLLDSKKRN